MELFLLKDINLAFVKHEVTCLTKKSSKPPVGRVGTLPSNAWGNWGGGGGGKRVWV